VGAASGEVHANITDDGILVTLDVGEILVVTLPTADWLRWSVAELDVTTLTQLDGTAPDTSPARSPAMAVFRFRADAEGGSRLVIEEVQAEEMQAGKDWQGSGDSTGRRFRLLVQVRHFTEQE
jgi:hypothetical protein